MARTWIAIAASVVAVGVLATLIVSSRPVDVQEFNLHYQQLSIIDQSLANYESLLDQLAAARRDGRPTGSGVALMIERLATTRMDVAKAVKSGRSNPHWNAYDAELKRVLDFAARAQSQQNFIGNALQQIRDNGPLEVQKLKAAGYAAESQKFYKVLLSTIGLGTPGANTNVENITEALNTLTRNDKLLSTSFLLLVDAIEKVINNREDTDAIWQQLSTTTYAQVTNKIRNSFTVAHTDRMRAVENSRILLSIFSVALFGGLGLLGYRLQSSYREIADVNEQLVHANEFLESRVAKRTRDLTKAFDELKESQVQLVQAEKMSSLGQLVAGISHEINTPLLYLQSNQTLIKETLSRVDDFVNMCYEKLIPRARPSDDKDLVKQRYVQGLLELKNTFVKHEIKDEIAEIKNLTDDNLEGLNELMLLAQGLKDFSRLDRAPVENFSVNEGIKRTLLIARNMLKNKFTITQNLQEVPAVSCAPSQINQIFLNLITNATQAMQDGGEITITTSADEDFVCIAIRDSGCGIPEDLIAKVRDPFFTTKEVGKGTGLGLSIVEEILAAHRGRLEIESTVGEGSTFTILLPLKPPARRAEDRVETDAQVMSESDERETRPAAENADRHSNDDAIALSI